MKQFFRQFGIATVLAGAMLPAVAATPIFNYDFQNKDDFDAQFSVIDNNYDDFTWQWYKYSTKGDYRYARCYSWDTDEYDDYMTTKAAYHLEPGKAYRLTYAAFKDDSYGTGTLSIGYTPDANPLTGPVTLIATETLTNINKYELQDYPVYTRYFEVAEAGDYYFTFRAGGTKGACVTNIELVDNGSPNAPAAVNTLFAVADPGFAAKATISCVLPTKTITGGDLASISSLEIMCGETVVHTATTGLTPGAEFSWTHENAPTGDVTYTVTLTTDGNRGDSKSASTFIGPLVAKAVTGLSLAAGDTPDSYVVSWTAPTMSVNDRLLDASQLKYKVYRVVDEAETLVGNNIETTSFTDEFISPSRVSLSYKVVALYGTTESEAAATAPIRVGMANLPITESFAAGSLGEFSTEAYNGTYKWEFVAKGSSPTCDPWDADGGMVQYRSYSAGKGNGARLISPVFATSEATNATITYYLYKNDNSRYQDKVRIDIRKDGGEWETIEGSEVNVDVNGSSGWEMQMCNFQSAIAGSTNFQVAIASVSDYGYNAHVDNVRIYNALTKDLKVELSGPATCRAGSEAVYTAKVTNATAVTCPAADYTVSFFVDGEEAAVMDGVELTSMAYNDFTFTRKFTAASGDEVEVKAVVNYTGDQDVTNNEAIQATAVAVSAYPTVIDPQGTLDGENIHLSWTAPIDNSGIINIDTTEDFADAVSNEAHTLAGWKAVDLDGEEAGTRFGANNSIWDIYTAPSGNTYAPAATSGKVVGVVTPQVVAKKPNDWLISPELTPCEGASIKVTFYAMAINFGTKMAIAYSTTDDNPENFIRVHEQMIPQKTSSTSYTPISAEVPSTAKYVAINIFDHNSTSDLVVLDKVTMKTQAVIVNGYNVYEGGEMLNEAPIAETSYDVPAQATARSSEQRTFHITALYDDAESALSDPVTVDINTGVAEVGDDAYITVLPGAVKATAAMQVFGLDGRLVAATSGAGTVRLPAGVYVVRCAGKGVKVLVK